MEIASTGIVILTVALLAFWVLLNRSAIRSTAPRGETPSSGASFAFGLIAWLALTAVYAITGIVETDARLMIVALVPAFGGAAAMAMSKLGHRLASTTPWVVLIGYLAFRLPLELILYSTYLESRLPVQMTFHGLNYDIVIGASALLLGVWAALSTPPSLLLIAWNTVGLGLLSVAGTVALLSMPTPLREFTNEPSTMLLSTFPYIWIPTFLAASALAGHILIFRKLIIERCSSCKQQNTEALSLTSISNEKEMIHV